MLERERERDKERESLALCGSAWGVFCWVCWVYWQGMRKHRERER